MKIGLMAMVAAVVVSGGEVVWAQTNSWTSSVSGHWEDFTWSLGGPPTTNNSVMITNSGSKAVGIFPTTPIAFATNMTITNLTLSGPPGFTNMLLLNYFGTNNPLHVLNHVEIDFGGIIDNQYGSLVFGGDCYIFQGSWIQEGGLWKGTNGGVTLVDANVGLDNAQAEFSSLGVYAGSIIGQTNCDVAADNLTVQTATCFLNNTSFRGDIFIGEFGPGIQSGDVYQTGGTNIGNLDSAKGNYTLSNGVFLGSVDLGRESSFHEVNSFVSGPSFGLGSFQDGSTWTAGNCTNYAGSLDVGGGSFTQTGGVLVVTNFISVHGFFDDYGPVWFASLGIGGVMVHCGSFDVSVFASATQSGTNIVDGDLFLSGGSYSLGDGLLQTSNTSVGVYYGDAIFVSAFGQSGGTHLVKGALGIGGNYNLSGGILSATNIYLGHIMDSAFTISSNASSIPAIINVAQFYAGGTLRLSGSAQQLGILVLTDNSTFDFTATPGQLKFLNSSAALWTNGVMLTISNWVGPANGKGPDRLFVGNNAGGLTPSQLNQIRFVNPGGFAAGTYFAEILESGEVVPTIHPHLVTSRNGGSLVLTWPAPFTLESSTNLQGPFLAVPGAASPFTNFLSEPRRFFRLRQ
jgi:hypothetical protein